MTKIAFYGSSLLSSYWNGAATYYRGLIRQLAKLGYQVTFYEPNVYDRQKHRDMVPPTWCKVVVYEGTREALKEAAAEAREADVVVKASGVGFEDEALMDHVLSAARPDALKIYWDVDAPATLAQLGQEPDHPLHGQLQKVDLVLTYGGGDPVVYGYRTFGARACVPIYNALDPDTHRPVRPDDRFAADLAFLGNRLPDREARVETFFLDAAAKLPDAAFLLGGSGWCDKPMPANVRYIGHVSTRDHNCFNVTPKAVLNISRASMAANGYSPATRVFEAAGAGACLITDAWTGLELFLKEGEEVLSARDGQDVADAVASLTPAQAAEIGRRARARIMRDHTYAHRAAEVHRIITSHISPRQVEAAE
ncbi:CgeB family protein [Nitratireductor sp. GCM10026969]|uniref:CgeB family protein n=1 Tax=Nitratireductor sp. GCM10026969 TaxID=3252645 RepID=UPI00361F235F